MEEPQKENKYLSLIERCQEEVYVIRKLTGFILLEKLSESAIKPIGTELEQKLGNLLDSLQTLKKDINI